MTTADHLRSPLLAPAGMLLTAFEEHMLVDDRSSHPMVIVTRFDFVDDDPPANLEAAFFETLADEPLLTARVTKPRFGRACWTAGSAPPLGRRRVRHITDGLVQWTGAIPRLNPLSGPVLHAEVIEHGEGWSIVLAVHHAVADGIGLMGFLERWLLAAEGKPRRRTRTRETVVSALAARGRVAASWTRFALMLPKLAKGLEGVVDFVARDVVDLSAGDRQPSCLEAIQADSSWHPLIVSKTLDLGFVEALETRARANSVSVNDLLAMAMFVAIADHVVDSGSPTASREAWIRIGVPMSLRTKSDHLLPAANRVGMIFLDRRADERNAPLRLAISIRDQMEVITTHALGHIFPLSLEASRLFAGGLRRTADRPKPQCTAVLSNVGRFFRRSPLTDAAGTIRVGRGRLAGWWGVPPTRPGTALAAGTHETQGRRTIAFHSDRRRIPPDTAVQLLEKMTLELEKIAGGRTLPGQERLQQGVR